MIETDNLSEYKKYDIVVIGAGPAGIMAAIAAATASTSTSDLALTSVSGEASASDSASTSGTGNLSICILERNKSAAKKLLLTGNGRCNYTADIDMTGMLSAFGKKGRFFSEAFNEFSNRDLIAFFAAEGIEPEFEKSDENNSLIKVFPKNNNASSVRQCLIDKLQEKGIHVFYSFRVEKVLKVKNPNKTGENYFFEIQRCSDGGFDNHLNHDMKNNLKLDDIGTGDLSYNNLKADISGTGKSSIGGYVSDKSSIDGYISGNSSIDDSILNKEPFRLLASKVIIATGGRTYPQTGSTGDGYAIAKTLGHSVNELIPYLIPVFSKDRDIALLAGVSVKEAGLKILAGGKVVAKNRGSILFTHKGLSGPCAAGIGHEVYRLLNDKYKKDLAGCRSSILENRNQDNRNQDAGRISAAEHESYNQELKQNSNWDQMHDYDREHIHNSDRALNQNFGKHLKEDFDSGPNQDFIVASIDLAPDLSFEDFRKEIFKIYKSNPKKELNTILNMILKNVPQRLLDLILTRCKITKNLKIGNLSKIELAEIYNNAKNLVFKIDNLLHFDEAIVTEGGIPVKEINPRNLQSALNNGLYFAGEIIELAGPEGGFNLQKAFSTGWLAGKSAAESLY